MFKRTPKPKVPYLIAIGDESMRDFAIRNAEYTPQAVAPSNDTAKIVQAWQSANVGVEMLQTGDFVYIPQATAPGHPPMLSSSVPGCPTVNVQGLLNVEKALKALEAEDTHIKQLAIKEAAEAEVTLSSLNARLETYKRDHDRDVAGLKQDIAYLKGRWTSMTWRP